MGTSRFSQIVHLGLAVMCIVLVGCSDRLLRETVFANTETLIGIAVEQDAKTQMYQGRIGYVRHELFLVPTSKRVVYNTDGEQIPMTTTEHHGSKTTSTSKTSDDPSSTPEVLGEIMADGAIGMRDPQGNPVKVGVYQRLAVGKLAVTSNAAVALLARDSATADAFSPKALDRSLSDLATESKSYKFQVIENYQVKEVDWATATNVWAKEYGFMNYADLYEKGAPAVIHSFAQRWEAELKLSKLKTKQ